MQEAFENLCWSIIACLSPAKLEELRVDYLRLRAIMSRPDVAQSTTSVSKKKVCCEI